MSKDAARADSLQRAHAHVLHGYARLIRLEAEAQAQSGLQTLEDAEAFLGRVGRHLRGVTFTVESLRDLMFRAQRPAPQVAPVEPSERDVCPQCQGPLCYQSSASGARRVCLECTGGE